MSDNITRVLLVFGKLNRGGAETLAMNLYRNIDRRVLQFDFIIHTTEKCDYTDEILSMGGRIFSMPRYNVLNHFKYKKCWNDFLTEHPEYKVVHAHMTGPASVFLRICKRHGCYTVSHSHTVAPKNGLRQVIVNSYRFPLRRISDYMFACSEQAGEWMFGKNVSKKKNYSVLKNGIDIDSFAYNPQWRDEIRNEFNLNGKFVITDVARFHMQKNHDFLLDIFCEIHKRNSNSALLLVGDGERRQELEERVKALRLEDSVIFAGVRADVNKILSACDVFVMPSVFEGLPVSLIEAQASGIHSIVTDTVSDEIKITDLVESLSLNEPPARWADAVLKYADGYERRDTSKDIADAGYDIKATAKKLQEFYLSVSE
ncbi:MAG: glycosyltransferase family 1 protein [Eubacterium sp.]